MELSRLTPLKLVKKSPLSAEAPLLPILDAGWPSASERGLGPAIIAPMHGRRSPNNLYTDPRGTAAHEIEAAERKALASDGPDRLLRRLDRLSS